MSTRQYIGARYVPKFYTNSVDGSTQWEANVVYEPLIYVTLQNGHMYISKKQVPATVGTPASNIEYWLDIGSINGFVEELQAEVDALEADVAKIPTQRHIILCGDSYVQGIGGGSTNLETVIEGLTNWDVRRFYAGGCGYLRTNDQSKKMLDVVQDAVNATTDKDIITDVVLAASVYNDTGMSGQSSFTEASFISALEAINALVKANFPKARVTVIPALWINTSYNTDFMRIWQWTQSGAQKIGANYAKQSINWLMVYDSSVDSGDHVHPSALGFTIIGNHIASVINGCEPSLYTGVETVATATNDSLRITYFDDHAHIRGTISKEDGQTFASLFNVPLPLQKLSNYPVPFVVYGTGTVRYFLITGATTFFASDWLEVGTTYLIDYDVPYFNFT